MPSDHDMTVVEVGKNLIKVMKALGFTHARAARALHYSGNASLEDAVNWIIDHENDADIDEMPLVERRQQLGFPSENPTSVNPSKSVAQDKMTSLPVIQSQKADQIREYLRSLRHNHKADDARVKSAFLTLLIYFGSIIEKYRKIRLGNPLFQDRVESLKGGIEFLELCGFEKTAGGDFLYLPSKKVDMAVLHLADSLIRSAMTNPFFGLLSL